MSIDAQSNNYKSGFITLLGRPNSGKSTLLNCILGQKVVITSDKPQTTRNSIRGIYTGADYQLIFIDTPGVQKPRYKLEQEMMSAVRNALLAVDGVIYLVDATADFGGGEQYILKELGRQQAPVFLAINKIDLLPKDKLLPLIDFYRGKYNFAEIIPISAANGENVDKFLTLWPQYLPPGPQYYPDGMVSDQPEQQLIGELVREQVFKQMRQEIPHSVAVNLNALEERENGLLYVEAIIYVERDSQKGIIIGKNGQTLKNIGKAARQEISRLLFCEVYLELRVKMRKDWRNNETLLRNWQLTSE